MNEGVRQEVSGWVSEDVREGGKEGGISDVLCLLRL